MRALTAVTGGLDGIRPRQLIDGHDARGRLVVAGGYAIGLLAQLDPGDVAEVNDGAIGVGADDDGAKLLWLDQTSLGADGVGKLLPLGIGSAPIWPAGFTLFCTSGSR